MDPAHAQICTDQLISAIESCNLISTPANARLQFMQSAANIIANSPEMAAEITRRALAKYEEQN